MSITSRPPVTDEVLIAGQRIVELLTEADSLAKKHYQTGLVTHSLSTGDALKCVLYAQQRLLARRVAEDKS
jgi:hypothetical protein